MAGSRKPGPLGLEPEIQNLNDGTHVRSLSPLPKLIGAKTTSITSIHGKTKPSVVLPNIPDNRKKAIKLALQILRQGSRGTEVQKLQRLLNVRLSPSPNLLLDGIFGSLTHQAVLQYQKGILIKTDGIVGKQTLYHLLKGDNAIVPQMLIPKAPTVVNKPDITPKIQTTVQPQKAALPPSIEDKIWEWSLEKKLSAVVDRVPKRLIKQGHKELMALKDLDNLLITLVIFAGFCLLSGGTAFILGGAILGFDLGMSLYYCVQTAALASSDSELDEAADYLAHIIIIITLTTTLTIFLARLRSSIKGGGKSAIEEVPPNKESVLPPKKTPPPPEKTPPAPKKTPPPPEETPPTPKKTPPPPEETPPPPKKTPPPPEETPTYPKNPDDLLDNGYQETSHPEAKANGIRRFKNPTNGDEVEFHKGKSGENGWEGKDHWHRFNPNKTGKGNAMLDKNGQPVRKGSEPSHLKPR
jgi:hypothetical protein